MCFKAAATYFRLGSALSTGSIMVGSWLNSTTCSATASPHSSPNSLGAAGMSRLQEQVQGQVFVPSMICQVGRAARTFLLHEQAAQFGLMGKGRQMLRHDRLHSSDSSLNVAI